MELFARLALTTLGASVLAAIIFSTTPRPGRISPFRGEHPKTVSTVGFNDSITLGGLGEALENRQEVMQLKLLDKATRQIYPMYDHDVYLRGSTVAWYSENHWRRGPPMPRNGLGKDQRTVADASRENIGPNGRGLALTSRLGPPVVQQISTEPYLEREDVFYIWPLAEPVQEELTASATARRPAD